MNKRHSGVTDWGLKNVVVRENDTVLDVGCGGGRTVEKLAAMARRGKVYGVDHASESVGVACKLNLESIKAGRVEVREGSVEALPYADDMFDVVTAVETHFWWPDPARDMREVQRVVKPGGAVVVIAEVYKGAENRTSRLMEKYAPKTGLKMFSVDEHRALLEGAGFRDVEITTDSAKGWICCVGRKQ
jgi:ubiquinone/menaquinone biosynthesis C-methylase UbiE